MASAAVSRKEEPFFLQDASFCNISLFSTSTNCHALLRFEDGAINEQGSAAGTYIHGLFDNADFTRTLLNQLRAGKGIAPLPLSQFSYQLYKEQQFDILADAMRQHIDIEEIYKIMQQQQQNRSAV